MARPLPRPVRFGTPSPFDDWHWEGPESMPLPVREVFMMIVMDRLTEDADWHTKVFDGESVGR